MISKIKKNPFLSGIISMYIFLFIVNGEKAMIALGNTAFYLKEMLIIMPVVFLLTALIDAWVPKSMIMSALGESSGIKGSFTALVLGSISAGPIYAAFPVAKTLLKKGASIGNIVVILSAWAVIKIPMLANEVKFLGPKFMIARWIFTVASIMAMSYIISKIVEKDDIPLGENILKIGEIKVDKSACIGCEICANISPDYFEMDESGKKKIAVTKIDHIKPEKKKQVLEARNKCPVSAIEVGGM